ncbi:hypothetical protein HY025_06305 [Candidatus Daviesbacteria bacterium]|nr:hypothetical protein [Candidatus Daviesbacteria bacterium]
MANGEIPRQIDENTARAMLAALEVLSGRTTMEEGLAAYATVMADIREGLRKGIFPHPKRLFGLFGQSSNSLDRLAQDEAMILHGETIVDYNGWRAFLPSSRGISEEAGVELIEDGLTFLHDPSKYFDVEGSQDTGYRSPSKVTKMEISITNGPRRRFKLDVYHHKNYDDVLEQSVYLPHFQLGDILQAHLGLENTKHVSGEESNPSTYIFRLRIPIVPVKNQKIEATRMRAV